MRDLPAALAASGWHPIVLTPSYGTLHKLDGSKRVGDIDVRFRHATHPVQVYSVPGTATGVDNVVFDHALFAPGEPGLVYNVDDDGSPPFAVDADKFAFYCSAAAAFIARRQRSPTAIHLHDWHTGMFAVLKSFDPSLEQIATVPLVFTIHNLSYQGQRPMAGDSSSLGGWYPWLHVDTDVVSEPGDRGLFNPMVAAIRLADRVNTVSPTYAEEIVNPSDRDAGFIGGEGLEELLRERRDDGGLVGILNGCDYSEMTPSKPGWQALVLSARKTVESWQIDAPHPAHDIALKRLEALPKRRPLHVLTSIGRIVDQKTRLFLEPTPGGQTAIEEILGIIGRHGVFFLIGSGDANYEQQLVDIAERHDNLVYLRGYSETLGDAMYAAGDLFLMPSSFEPCGISQLRAMRAGQPCVVHGVGGLRDTVEDGVNGFVFEGRNLPEQAGNFVKRVAEVLAARHNDPLYWHSLRDAARAARFDWSSSAGRYAKELYESRSS